MDSVADIIRERANRSFAKADAAREQGKIEHALKLANLASHIMNEAAAADAAESRPRKERESEARPASSSPVAPGSDQRAEGPQTRRSSPLITPRW